VTRAAVFVAVMALVGCSSGRPPIVLSADGKIGSLQMGKSDARAIVAFAGRPDAERSGTEFDSARFRALGYECERKNFDHAWPLLEHGPYCRTVFWVNTRTGRLGDFYTTSTRYVESHGVRLGTRSAVAERRLHQRLYLGCEENIELGSLAIAFAGGAPGAKRHVTGAHVYAFALHGGRSDVGIFDCL
jgi:hypothetical protein